MSLFPNLFDVFNLFDTDNESSHSPFRPDPICDKPKEYTLPRKERKKFEEICKTINPTLGDYVETGNNIVDSTENIKDSVNNGILREIFSSEVKTLEAADHIFVQRFGYTHHGIYIGNNTVIHYVNEDGNISIKEDTLENFADGNKIYKKSKEESPLSYSQQKAINRAYSRLGETEYNLACNNCENFVRWCRNGS